MSLDIAYVSSGKLHLKFGDAAPRRVESKFATEVRERLLRVAQRNAWKTEGSGAQFMGGRLLWGMKAADEEMAPIRISGVTRGATPGKVVYALAGQDVGGLFVFDAETLEEKRLIHGSDHYYRDLAYDALRDSVCCSVAKRDGSASIAVMRSDYSEYAELTEGDSVDTSPSWVPGERRALVFASTGIARDRKGAPAGYAPSVIQRLDLEDGEMTVIAEEKNYGLDQPRMTAGGDLYYIRRPHFAPRPSFWRANLDFLLFPVRLLVAIMQFLNFFTTRYAGKPLTTAGNARRRGADIRQMMVWANLMEANEETEEGEPKAIVPKSFQLVRQRGIRSETVARNVVAYDLAADGTIVYSTGTAVYAVSADGKRQRLCEDGSISHVIAL